MLKASAGGGGIGIVKVDSAENMEEELDKVRRLAKSSFGDDAVFIEQYIHEPHHVEFQVIGDKHGNLIHVYDRECSVQRRNQKLIEETPSQAISQEIRMEMGEQAKLAANTAGYYNAGTCEFMYKDGKYYFLEMNTRLQVEHAITEMTTGIDIVKWQLRIASGEPLTLEQDDIQQRGHAIECRIYAEDPEQDFMPSTGKLKKVDVPQGINIRHDTGVKEGLEITSYYDPMLAKLIVHGERREDAIRKMEWALSNYITLGVTTNVPFLRAIIGHGAFLEGDIDTHFIDRHFKDWIMAAELPVEVLIAAAMDDMSRSMTIDSTDEKDEVHDAHSPWKHAGSRRIDS
ncbi:MAG: acetyl-CoA carboxylase biotin carboxylase subunit, partial [Thermoplasmata archaeon]|nr:acetyl-CoA carboxylase biotin carboxylase subunit [Thermoplasmata archaeon]